MQVFKTFMKVTKKRIHTILIYVVIFILLGFMMSSSSSKDNNFEETKLDIAVIDLDETNASKALNDYIGSKHELVDVENNKDEIIDALYYTRADYVLVINKGYSENLLNGKTDNLFSNYKMPDSYDAAFIEPQLDEYVRVITAYVAGGMSVDEAAVKSATIAENEVEVDMVNFSKTVGGEYNQDISNYYQYLAYILIAILITGLCPTLLVMFKKEIKNRTNCSCVSVTKQMTQIIAGTIIFSIALYALFTIVSIIIYGSDMFNQRGLLAMLNGFVFLLFAMMLTFFIAVISPSPRSVDMIANTVSLGMSFLCGVFVPQFLLSSTVLSIGKFLPAYWYVRANNMLSGVSGEIFSMNKFMTYVGIEFGFVIAFFCMTMLISKTKQRSKTV